MGYDYSIAMEGARAAERQFNDAAHKISRMGLRSRPAEGAEAAVSAEEAQDRLTLSDDMDISGTIVEAKAAKLQYTANLKVISMQMEMEDKTLDLFG